MNNQTRSNSPDIYSILSQTQRLRVSDGEIKPVLDGCSNTSKLLILIWSQLGDFDNLEYAWWLQREKEKISARGITIRAIGIGNRNSGIKFCEYTGFPQEWLFVDTVAEIHAFLGLYRGLSIQFPMLKTSQKSRLLHCYSHYNWSSRSLIIRKLGVRSDHLRAIALKPKTQLR